MRREEFVISDPYIGWLKSLGCIMYTPLRTDLKCLISGAEFVPTGDGAYKFVNDYCEVTTPSAAIYTALNMTLPALSSLTSKSYTVLAEAQVIQRSVAGNSCRCLLFANQAVNSESAPQWGGNPFWSAIPTNYQLYKAARTYSWDDKKTTVYLNGSQSNTGSETFDVTAMSSPYNQGFTLGCSGHNNYRNCKFRIRDIMFFTRALTLGEIRKIQGYE